MATNRLRDLTRDELKEVMRELLHELLSEFEQDRPDLKDGARPKAAAEKESKPRGKSYDEFVRELGIDV